MTPEVARAALRTAEAAVHELARRQETPMTTEFAIYCPVNGLIEPIGTAEQDDAVLLVEQVDRACPHSHTQEHHHTLMSREVPEWRTLPGWHTS